MEFQNKFSQQNQQKEIANQSKTFDFPINQPDNFENLRMPIFSISLSLIDKNDSILIKSFPKENQNNDIYKSEFTLDTLNQIFNGNFFSIQQCFNSLTNDFFEQKKVSLTLNHSNGEESLEIILLSSGNDQFKFLLKKIKNNDEIGNENGYFLGNQNNCIDLMNKTISQQKKEIELLKGEIMKINKKHEEDIKEIKEYFNREINKLKEKVNRNNSGGFNNNENSNKNNEKDIIFNDNTNNISNINVINDNNLSNSKNNRSINPINEIFNNINNNFKNDSNNININSNTNTIIRLNNNINKDNNIFNDNINNNTEIININKNDINNNINNINNFDIFNSAITSYSIECLTNKLDIDIPQGTPKAKIDFLIRNTSSQRLPPNTKLLCDHSKSTLICENIRLNPLNPGQQQMVSAIFKNLNKIPQGNYKSTVLLSSEGKKFLSSIELKVNVLDNKINPPQKGLGDNLFGAFVEDEAMEGNGNFGNRNLSQEIVNFRKQFDLPIDCLNDEIIGKALQMYDFDFNRAIGYISDFL